jgi:hypothetical protein
MIELGKSANRDGAETSQELTHHRSIPDARAAGKIFKDPRNDSHLPLHTERVLIVSWVIDLGWVMPLRMEASECTSMTARVLV